MKALKKIGIVLAVLVVIYLVLAVVGPSNYKVVRTIKIGAPVEVIYENTSIYANWAPWSPWVKMDPEAKHTLSDESQVVGASMSWKGEIIGEGKMTTTELVPNEKALYEISFTAPFVMTSRGGFIFTQEGDSVLVEWYDEGDFAFFDRPAMLFMDLEEQIGPSFEQGLAEIKKICEAAPATPAIEITVEEVESTTVLFISDSTKMEGDSIATKLGSAYGELMSYLGENEIEMAGVPLSICNRFSMEEMFYSFNAAIPVAEEVTTELTGRIKTEQTYAGKVVKAVHVGPYESSIATYNALMKYLEENDLEENGKSWEEYVSDPSKVAPEELITNIYIPVK